MVPSGALEPAFLHAPLALRLRHLPDERRAVPAAGFTALPGSTPADHHTSGIILAPSLGYMDRAYCDARQLG